MLVAVASTLMLLAGIVFCKKLAKWPLYHVILMFILSLSLGVVTGLTAAHFITPIPIVACGLITLVNLVLCAFFFQATLDLNCGRTLCLILLTELTAIVSLFYLVGERMSLVTLIYGAFAALIYLAVSHHTSTAWLNLDYIRL